MLFQMKHRIWDILVINMHNVFNIITSAVLVTNDMKPNFSFKFVFG